MAAVEESTRFEPRFDEQGLLSVVLVEESTNIVLTMAYMDEVALEQTMELQEVVLYSRSRQELWHKGSTSGNVLQVQSMYVDCDQDCLLIKVQVKGDGVSCHTGKKSCFYREIDTSRNVVQVLD